VERAAVADGSRFREVQRELRGSKPESRGTEIEVASDVEQKRNDIVGDVENTLHVRAELEKHQREAAIKATQMDAHVQCTVLAEIPATHPSPDSPQSVTSSTSATGGWKVWDPHISNLEDGLPAEDLSANARATGEVLTVEQSSNNDKGDVENTIQVLQN
jgi:hypothetical protein